MSMRLRIIGAGLSSIIVLVSVGVASGFVVFWLVSTPFAGARFTENISHIAARYFLYGGLMVLALVGIGAIWLVRINSRYIASPLRRLKKAATEIRDGNLDYEVAATGNDEFTELAACFEEMRIRIKNSVRLQEKAEMERRSMIASITHDLKTPITSILGYAEGIMDGVAGTPEKTREYAAVISKKARSLQNMAEDLALLSHLENAQLPLNKSEEDIGRFLMEIASDYFHVEHGATFTTRLQPNIKALIDKEKMARVLINIFQNSVKFKKPELPTLAVTISLVRQNGDALITISDNGMGINQEDAPYVFDRFYRADASRNPQKGSGLGLSIARGLVSLHGGKIWVINNHGDGVSVNISLPYANGK